MEHLRLARLWWRLERRSRGVHRRTSGGIVRLSVSGTPTIRPTVSGADLTDAVALTWRSDDPLAVHVAQLHGAVLRQGVCARDSLRVAAGRRQAVRLTDGSTVQVRTRLVRRLLAATDAVVPPSAEAPLVAEAADAMLRRLSART